MCYKIALTNLNGELKILLFITLKFSKIYDVGKDVLGSLSEISAAFKAFFRNLLYEKSIAKNEKSTSECGS